jgi:hypothetical protein
VSVVPFKPQREWVELMEPSVELAKAVANTDFVPRAMRGNPAAIAAAILYGDEVGLGPMQSLAKIVVIDGRPCLYAEAQRALILSAGHDLWLEESTATRCTWAGKRTNSDQSNRVTWTLDDAKRAGLAGKDAWRKYPRQLLSARASAELARAVFADAIGGLAAVEEVLEEEGGAEPVPLAAAPAGTTRRRRRGATAAVSSAPEPPPEPEPTPMPDDPEPPPEPAGAQPAPVISETDRRFLHARKRELGMSDEDLKDVIEEVTGQRSTKEIPAARYGDLLSALQRKALPADPEPTGRVFDAPPEATDPDRLPLGTEPHRDDG